MYDDTFHMIGGPSLDISRKVRPPPVYSFVTCGNAHNLAASTKHTPFPNLRQALRPPEYDPRCQYTCKDAYGHANDNMRQNIPPTYGPGQRSNGGIALFWNRRCRPPDDSGPYARRLAAETPIRKHAKRMNIRSKRHFTAFDLLWSAITERTG